MTSEPVLWLLLVVGVLQIARGLTVLYSAPVPDDEPRAWGPQRPGFYFIAGSVFIGVFLVFKVLRQ